MAGTHFPSTEGRRLSWLVAVTVYTARGHGCHLLTPVCTVVSTALKRDSWRCLRRNGSCERPVRLSWTPSESGYEAEFEVRHDGVRADAGLGRARVIYTDYRSALVYQCLQILADGACLPGQISVEIWSRRPTMPEIRCNVDCVKVLRPTRHRIGYSRDVLPSQSLGIVLKKPNLTQQK